MFVNWQSRCRLPNKMLNITVFSSFRCTKMVQVSATLRWRHNEHEDISNHQPHHCLLKHLFQRRSKKSSKLRVTGLCAGNSPGSGEFAAQMASNAENVSIWWRHHDLSSCNYNNVGNEKVWLPTLHDDVIKWKHFPRYWPFVWGIHRSRRIPQTKASDAELWCFLWSASE